MGLVDMRGQIMAVILSAVLISPPAFAQAANQESKLPINNFEKVTQTLWRGAAPSEQAMKQLAERGVKTVIDLRLPGNAAKKESNQAGKLGLNYFHISIGYFSPSVKQVNDFLSIVNDPKYQPVFVHCRQGADRTGTLVGIYRMLDEGWTFDQAYAEMRLHHFKPWLFGLKHTVAILGTNTGAKLATQTRSQL